MSCHHSNRFLSSSPQGNLYVCLTLCFAVGYSSIEALRFPFMLFSAGLLVAPAMGRFVWPIVVLYSQAFILLLYWRHYQ
jgi:hypothetical protein